MDEIKKSIGKIIDIIPEKTEEWLMIKFDGGSSMYFGGKGHDGIAYIEINLYKKAPMQNKKDLTEQVYSVFEKVLGMKSKDIFLTINEHENWGAEGKYK